MGEHIKACNAVSALPCQRDHSCSFQGELINACFTPVAQEGCLIVSGIKSGTEDLLCSSLCVTRCMDNGIILQYSYYTTCG